mmetsp:Transcript_5300/g.6769  ORF Transcript_5300/g.6769 Transcript_5300/m.6769 type:complete len:188 (+) Transcript_5300:69-632(+)|eukprot:CAMPEP_0201485510 /NCGR_PEP_ID=MMETSP0151_2-20130828/9603_1 /ASSEMBLY_ACC=CAM_ASM_000257 /TAXON_ID=200890 /ORGANISM="Paramoeba atlantica, Strain 621/1 / CCAP 1560/9" /LENGTH=187 /DNA_ID=CAMNT_0047869665 /DNA_START=68 /DNA_END=631 /DNA_ORIENTATION=-
MTDLTTENQGTGDSENPTDTMASVVLSAPSHFVFDEDEEPVDLSNFFVKFYVGHRGRYGHEFLQFTVANTGLLHYVNQSEYKKDGLIQKDVVCGGLILYQIRKIICDSKLLEYNDKKWPKAGRTGRQHLEIRLGTQTASYTTEKLGTLSEVECCTDAEGLKIFYYLSQDLKALIFALISTHFRIKPI